MTRNGSMIPFPNALTSEPACRIQTSRESWGSRSRGDTASAAGKDRAVYVSVTRVNTTDLEPEAPTIVAEEVDKWLRDIPGYEGFVMLARDGGSIAMSFWESREVADRHRLARMQIRERVTAV